VASPAPAIEEEDEVSAATAPVQAAAPAKQNAQDILNMIRNRQK
jgi:hypothetical protein